MKANDTSTRRYKRVKQREREGNGLRTESKVEKKCNAFLGNVCATNLITLFHC
jgi:hypothetical protein